MNNNQDKNNNYFSMMGLIKKMILVVFTAKECGTISIAWKKY